MKSLKYIIFLNLFFLISCKNNKIENTEKVVFVKEIAEKSTDSLSRGPKDLDYKTMEVKEETKVEKIIDTLPPKKTVRTLEEYKKNVKLFEQKIVSKEELTIKSIENVIPIKDKEFGVFYNLTYSTDKNQKLFDRINLEIFEHALEDKGNVFFLCLNMVEFVDGEYADSYFGDIEYVVMGNKKKFCAMFKYLAKGSKWRVEDLYKEVCLGIERPEEEDY
jgi:hypothetical protein